MRKIPSCTISTAALALLLPVAATAAQLGCDASPASAFGGTILDKELTFGGLGGNGPWQPSYLWRPDGLASSTISSWLITPNDASASSPDANPYSITPQGLSLRVMDSAADVSASAIGGEPYLSRRLTTKNAFSQLYGYFEMSAQMSGAPGVTSAFWLLPTDGSWPPDLDVEEISGGDPTNLIMTAHTTETGSHATIPQWADIPDSSKGFHTYGVDWEPNTITWYFDGQAVARQPTPADMHKPMYLLVDTLTDAHGGWDGSPTRSVNDAMKVRYVRAYPSMQAAQAAQASPSAPTPTATLASEPTPASQWLPCGQPEAAQVASVQAVHHSAAPPSIQPTAAEAAGPGRTTQGGTDHRMTRRGQMAPAHGTTTRARTRVHLARPWLTVMPRTASTSSTVHKASGKRKYSHTAWLMVSGVRPAQ